MGVSFLFSLLSSFFFILGLYRFQPMVWYNEARGAAQIIISESSLGSGLLILPIVVGLILIFLGNYFSEEMSRQEYRSFYHAIYGMIVISLLVFKNNVAFLFLSISLLLLLLAEYLRKSDDKSRVTLYVKKVLNKPLKSYEKRAYVASFSYIGGMIFVILFLPQKLALGSALILTLGDPAAAMIGIRYGKTKFAHNPDKTLEGSLAMLVVSILALNLIGLPFVLTFFASISAVFLESLDLRFSDNLLIPILAGIVMVSLA